MTGTSKKIIADIKMVKRDVKKISLVFTKFSPKYVHRNKGRTLLIVHFSKIKLGCLKNTKYFLTFTNLTLPSNNQIICETNNALLNLVFCLPW